MEPSYECGECGRTVPYEKDAVCVDCGKRGCFDFLGDYYCPACVNAWKKLPAESGLVEGCVPNAELTNEYVKQISKLANAEDRTISNIIAQLIKDGFKYREMQELASKEQQQAMMETETDS